MLGIRARIAVGHLTLVNIQANTITQLSVIKSKCKDNNIKDMAKVPLMIRGLVLYILCIFSLISWMLSCALWKKFGLDDFVAFNIKCTSLVLFPSFMSLCLPFFFNLSTLTFDLSIRNLTGSSNAHVSEVKPHGRGFYANIRQPEDEPICHCN